MANLKCMLWFVIIIFTDPHLIIVCRGFKTPPFINNPFPIIVYSPTFRILLIPPTPSSPTSRHFSHSLIVSKYITSICIKPCYDHLMKTIEEFSMKYLFKKENCVILSESVDSKQDC